MTMVRATTRNPTVSSPSSSPAKTKKKPVARKVIERNRRNHMKNLCSSLSSLLPPNPSKRRMALPDKLGEAAEYIQRLEERLKEAKERKDRLVSMATNRANNSHTSCRETSSSSSSGLEAVPKMEVHEMGSALEVILTTNLDHQFMMYEVIRILHQETVEVLNAHLSVIGNTIFHSVHAKIEGSMFCFRAAAIREKLKRLVGLGLACEEEELKEGQREEEYWLWGDEVIRFGNSDFTYI